MHKGMSDTTQVHVSARRNEEDALIRVLYLDDAPLDRALIREVLLVEEGGFAVVEVASREALEQHLRQGGVDLVLSEVTIPGVEGGKVLELVRRVAPDLPVVITTATGSDALAAALMKQGAADYVPKTPSGMAALPHTLRSVITERHTGGGGAPSPGEVPLPALLERALELVFVLDGEARIVYTGLSVSRILGYPHDALLGQPVLDFLHAEDEGTFEPVFQAVLRQGGEGKCVCRFRDESGAWRMLDVVGTRWDEDGRLPRVILNARDITERRWAEEALRESEQQYRVLIEQSADAIYVEQGATIALVNQAWEKLFGYSRVEVLSGFDLSRVMAPAGRARIDERRKRRAAGLPVEQVFEITGLRRDGRVLDLEVSEADILWKGRPAIQGIFRDVTDRKRAERDLRRYAKRLEVLRAIDQSLLSAQSSEGIAEAAIRHLPRLVPCLWAGVLLTEPDTDRLSLAAQTGTALALDTGLACHCDDLGGGGFKVRILDPGVQALRTTAIGQAWQRAGIRSVLCCPLLMQTQVLGFLALGVPAETTLQEPHHLIVREVAEQLSVAVHSTRLFEAVGAARTRLRQLSHRLVEVQEQERRHIALELHDEIGQVLTALNFTLDFSESPLSREDREKLARARELVDMITTKVRDLSLNLRPSMLDDLGLLPALMWYFGRYQERTGILVRFEPDDLTGRRFSPEVETTAYRIVQEALNNVARYAGVDTVDVRIATGSDTLRLEVIDRGYGFDPRHVAEGRPSAGLSGMQERAALVGGLVEVEAQPGAGVRIRAELPRRPVTGSPERPA